MKGWRCRCCGEVHGELPMHYGAHAPALWFIIPEAEREQRCVLSSDQCIIDDQHFFIVGNLKLPVAGVTEAFSWDVWVSLSHRNFARACDRGNSPAGSRNRPTSDGSARLYPGTQKPCTSRPTSTRARWGAGRAWSWSRRTTHLP